MKMQLPSRCGSTAASGGIIVTSWMSKTILPCGEKKYIMPVSILTGFFSWAEENTRVWPRHFWWKFIGVESCSRCKPIGKLESKWGRCICFNVVDTCMVSNVLWKALGVMILNIFWIADETLWIWNQNIIHPSRTCQTFTWTHLTGNKSWGNHLVQKAF